jgi:hypothetical protein
MMHGPEKSDLAIVAGKPANKAEQSAAEPDYDLFAYAESEVALPVHFASNSQTVQEMQFAE